MHGNLLQKHRVGFDHVHVVEGLELPNVLINLTHVAKLLRVFVFFVSTPHKDLKVLNAVLAFTVVVDNVLNQLDIDIVGLNSILDIL